MRFFDMYYFNGNAWGFGCQFFFCLSSIKRTFPSSVNYFALQENEFAR